MFLNLFMILGKLLFFFLSLVSHKCQAKEKSEAQLEKVWCDELMFWSLKRKYKIVEKVLNETKAFFLMLSVRICSDR